MNHMKLNSTTLISILLFILLIFGLTYVQGEHHPTDNSIIYVDDIPGSGPDNPPEDFTSIQDAINSSKSGDTIYIYNGTYYENLTVYKPITLQGQNKSSVIIDANQKEITIHIKSSNVTINNLTITNSSKGGWSVGICIIEKMWNSPSNPINILENIIISDCNIIQNEGGIKLITVKNIIISNCNIHHNTWSSISGYDLDNIIINNCQINNNGFRSDDRVQRGGIFLYGAHGMCYNITITNCIISNNIFCGMWLDCDVSNVLIHNNTIKNNDELGLLIQCCKNITISNNTIQSHNGDFALDGGIYIRDNEDSHIIKNNNIISNYPNGIYIASSTPNIITKNNIINNTHDVTFETVQPVNHIWKNNYWDKKTFPFGPKIIFGKIYGVKLPWINFDWSPARTPHIFN